MGSRPIMQFKYAALASGLKREKNRVTQRERSYDFLW